MSHTPTNSTPYVEPYSALTPSAVEWLWLRRLALGDLALLEGDPGRSKSLVALDLCARLSTGRPMPDGSPGPGVASALVLQTEDSHEATVLPRLQALGADVHRVFRWKPPEDVETPLRIPTDLGLLDDAITATGARLVVIDPLVDFLDPAVGVGSEQSIRRAFAPLRRLAQQHRCVMLLVRHLIKRQMARALYRGGGSIGIIAVCRSCWLVGSDPHDEQRRVLAQVKNTHVLPQPSLAFTLNSDGDGPATPHWLGESPWRADQLVLAPSFPAPARDRAEAFVREFLKDGPRLSAEVWAAALAQGFSESTLRRGYEKAGVRFQQVHRDGVRRMYWLLGDQELPAAASDATIGEDIRRLLAEQERKFPRPCPLDDEIG